MHTIRYIIIHYLIICIVTNTRELLQYRVCLRKFLQVKYHRISFFGAPISAVDFFFTFGQRTEYISSRAQPKNCRANATLEHFLSIVISQNLELATSFPNDYSYLAAPFCISTGLFPRLIPYRTLIYLLVPHDRTLIISIKGQISTTDRWRGVIARKKWSSLCGLVTPCGLRHLGPRWFK